MKEWLFPWEAEVMIHYPYVMPMFMFFASLLLSFITWIREGRVDNQSKVEGKSK